MSSAPRTRRKSTCARSRSPARTSRSSTGSSTTAASASRKDASAWAGSTSRRSRSPTASRARRRWASSSRSSSAGRCPTSSSTRPAAAPGSSACGRRSPNSRRSASSDPSGRGWSPCRRRAARRSCARAGRRRARDPWQDAQTYAAGIRVPAAIGDFLILRAVRESGGFAIAVDDEDIRRALADVATDRRPSSLPGRRGDRRRLARGPRRRPRRRP